MCFLLWFLVEARCGAVSMRRSRALAAGVRDGVISRGCVPARTRTLPLSGVSAAMEQATDSPASSMSWSTEKPSGPMSSSSTVTASACVLHPSLRGCGSVLTGARAWHHEAEEIVEIAHAFGQMCSETNAQHTRGKLRLADASRGCGFVIQLEESDANACHHDCSKMAWLGVTERPLHRTHEHKELPKVTAHR